MGFEKDSVIWNITNTMISLRRNLFIFAKEATSHGGGEDQLVLWSSELAALWEGEPSVSDKQLLRHPSSPPQQRHKYNEIFEERQKCNNKLGK